jgi:hypothetical protein
MTKDDILIKLKNGVKVKGVYVFWCDCYRKKYRCIKIGCSDTIQNRIRDYKIAFPIDGLFYVWYKSKSCKTGVREVEKFLLDNFSETHRDPETKHEGGDEVFILKPEENLDHMLERVKNLLSRNYPGFIPITNGSGELLAIKSNDYPECTTKINPDDYILLDFDLVRDNKNRTCAICTRPHKTVTYKCKLMHNECTDKSIDICWIGSTCFGRLYQDSFFLGTDTVEIPEDKLFNVQIASFILKMLDNSKDDNIANMLENVHEFCPEKKAMIIYLAYYIFVRRQEYINVEITQTDIESWLNPDEKYMKIFPKTGNFFRDRNIDLFRIYDLLRLCDCIFELNKTELCWEKPDIIFEINSITISCNLPELQPKFISENFKSIIQKIPQKVPNLNRNVFKAFQKEILTEKYRIITTPAGCGKSFIGEQILKFHTDRTLICSPSYVRLEKMKMALIEDGQKIGFNGLVIQAVKLCNDPNRFNDGFAGPIKATNCKYLVVEEFGMFSIIEVLRLVMLVKKLTELEYIFISGDKRQLPPIGFEKETLEFRKLLAEGVIKDFPVNKVKLLRFPTETDRKIAIDLNMNYDKLNIEYLKENFKQCSITDVTKDELGCDANFQVQTQILASTNSSVAKYNKEIRKIVYDCKDCDANIRVEKNRYATKFCKKCITMYDYLAYDNIGDGLIKDVTCLGNYHYMIGSGKCKKCPRLIADQDLDNYTTSCRSCKNAVEILKNLAIVPIIDPLGDIKYKRTKNTRQKRILLNGQNVSLKEDDIYRDFYNVNNGTENFLYKKSDIANLSLHLSYCKTIHKSQGDTYRNVILIYDNQKIDGSYIYTALTRAKNISNCRLIFDIREKPKPNQQSDNSNSAQISVIQDVNEELETIDDGKTLSKFIMKRFKHQNLYRDINPELFRKLLDNEKPDDEKYENIRYMLLFKPIEGISRPEYKNAAQHVRPRPSEK